MKMTKLVSAPVVTGWARWRFWKERGEDPLGLGLGKNCRWFSGGFHGDIGYRINKDKPTLVYNIRDGSFSGLPNYHS
jgi:hypothetical protein